MQEMVENAAMVPTLARLSGRRAGRDEFHPNHAFSFPEVNHTPLRGVCGAGRRTVRLICGFIRPATVPSPGTGTNGEH